MDGPVDEGVDGRSTPLPPGDAVEGVPRLPTTPAHDGEETWRGAAVVGNRGTLVAKGAARGWIAESGGLGMGRNGGFIRHGDRCGH